ncbi:MAG: hypothetical protein H6827_00290 [Planctomycetes bacterium]|nr:hypothetical protein [Planctomycetota bacterium]
MELKFYCYSCAQPIAVEDTWAGLEVHCPTCRAELRIPTAPGTVPTAARPLVAQCSSRSELAPVAESPAQWPSWLQPLRQVPGQPLRRPLGIGVLGGLTVFVGICGILALLTGPGSLPTSGFQAAASNEAARGLGLLGLVAGAIGVGLLRGWNWARLVLAGTLIFAAITDPFILATGALGPSDQGALLLGVCLLGVGRLYIAAYLLSPRVSAYCKEMRDSRAIHRLAATPRSETPCLDWTGQLGVASQVSLLPSASVRAPWAQVVVAKGGVQCGPYTPAQLIEFHKTGALDAADFAWDPVAGQWLPLILFLNSLPVPAAKASAHERGAEEGEERNGMGVPAFELPARKELGFDRLLPAT